jgi:membrane-associated phospholipid phosphatase
LTFRRTLVELSLRRMNIDRWVVVYLLVSAFYPFLRPGVSPSPLTNALVHAVLALAIWFIPPMLRCSRHFIPRLFGEIYLPFIFPFFYAEMEYLGLIFFDFESSLDPALIQIEQAIFGMQPSLEWSRVWPWAWFHELMEFAYFSYYFLFASFILLLFLVRGVDKDKQWDVLRDYIRDLSTVMLLCYTFYTIFPAWGPKYFRIGYVEVGGWIFTDIMLHIHKNGALLGAAFPSSHVAASMIPWWYTWRYFPRHRGWMTTIWILLCMSTVYNRYHYVVDVFAGILLSALILTFGHLLGDRARDNLRMRRFPKLRRDKKN